jgi:N-methylhydantoinase A
MRYRIGMRERTLATGEQLIPLEARSLDWLRTKIEQLKPESIAVVLLYSYLNPQNERRIQEALQDLDLPLSASHRILPEFREYERTSTTVINAYVQPIMANYLGGLEKDPLVSSGQLMVMQSNGGTINSEVARSEPVRTLFSGPAGGVVGAFEIAGQAGYEKILTLDMGGTSTDVCLCDGRIETTNQASIDHHPVSTQMIGIHTVGAGGGSIAWVDQGGLLKVGPESAGADPGPVCYGKGQQLTVTDANLYLGLLDPDHFLGGNLKLEPDRIQPALEDLGNRLSQTEDRTWTPQEVAEGVIRIVNTQMEGALRLISLQRGYDTRDFTLVAFGGAGGLHACALARALMIPRILIPLNPGTLSALGILRSDFVRDASRTVVLASHDTQLSSKLNSEFSLLMNSIRNDLLEQGFSSSQITLEQSVDLRYLGQSYEIQVPFSQHFLQDFHKEHQRLYGYDCPDLTVEVVCARVRGRARHDLPPVLRYPGGGRTPPKAALLQEKKTILGGKKRATRFYLRDRLKPNNRISGPAVIVEYSATTFVAGGFRAVIDPWLNIVVESS